NRRGQDGRGGVDYAAVQVAVNDREWQSGAPEDLTRKLPATERLVHPVAAEVVGRMEHKVAVEAVANVVIRTAIVALAKATGADLTSGEGVAVGEDAAVGGLIQVVRPGVVGVGRNPMREVTPDANRQPVVVGYRAVLDLRDGPVVGIRNVRRQRAGRIDTVRVIGVIVAIGVRNHNAVIADVVYYQRGRGIQLLLELQVPLLPGWSMNGAVQSGKCR